MPLLLAGSNFYFFTDSYCACIGLNAWFALPTKEGGKERGFRPITKIVAQIRLEVNKYFFVRGENGAEACLLNSNF